jgi:predicted metalloprotease with PDZ domain
MLHRFFLSLAASICVVAFLEYGDLQAEETRCELQIDLREVDRNIISSQIRIPVKPGHLSLWYPKWLPGCHAAAGPVQNLGFFQVETDQGIVLPWKRRSAEPYEFLLEVPDGTNSILVKLEYIANQPTTNSEGADCAFEGNIGYFSFNACVVYPTSDESVYGKGDELIYDVSLSLPDSIEARSALRIQSESETGNGKVLKYAAAPLHRIVDCPLILGEHIHTIELTENDSPQRPHFLHIASRDEIVEQIPIDFVHGLRGLVAETEAVFGAAPFDEYHFLVIVDDSLADIGLEHLSSSLNTMSLDELTDPGLRADWPGELLPHEYVHAWCGKYRVPKSMSPLDFHTDRNFNLLWVYEGLTEYYGTVLATRSGLVTKETFLEHRAQRIHELTLQAGRNWRTLEDTAVTSPLLRDYSTYWTYRRRDQDYYDEGAFYWLEADAVIRKESQGKVSLDDFCRKFFSKNLDGENADAEFIPYREIDLYRVLNEIHQHDWKQFFEKRVKSTQKSLNLRALAKSGYRLAYTNKMNEYQERLESEYLYIDETRSLGFTVGPKGLIMDIVPNSIVDRAKLAERDRLIEINGEKYSDERLRKWLDECDTGDKLRFKVSRYNRQFDVELTIENPKARFPYLQVDGELDIIEEITASKLELVVP